jgi:arginyl-tRNA synthetase
MTLKEVINQIRQIVNKALLDLEYEKIEYDVSEPPKTEFGDLTTNIAFLLSKRIHKNPNEIAKELVSNSINFQLNNIGKDSLILNANAHISGHINFNINYAIFNKFLLKLVKQKDLLLPPSGLNKQIVIEHTSVNPNKALHIGHLRNVIIGDSLYRLFKLTNHKTIVLNYIDDSGVQIADLIVAFKFAGFNENVQENIKFDQYCGEIYVRMNELYKTNLELIEKRKLVIKEIEQGNTELALFTQYIVEKIVKQQLKSCWRIKSRYDLLVIESQILLSKLWEKTFSLLKEKNIIYYSTKGKNMNCWVLRDEHNEEKVIIRSDGTATYIAKDISFAVWKLHLVDDPFTYNKFSLQWDKSILWKTMLKPENIDNSFHQQSDLFFMEDRPNKVITVIDSRQARLQNIISTVLSDIDPNINNTYIYLGYETVALSPNSVQDIGVELDKITKKIIHMSGRKGIFINVDTILDKLHQKACYEVRKRNPDFDDTTISEIAEGIAVSAIRYNLLRQDIDKMITFDMEEALNLDGDTSLYLQYSFARAMRILEKGNGSLEECINEKNANIRCDLLNHPIETDLIKEISKFNIIIEEALNSLNPKVITKYANRISTKFNSFYENVPVLGAELILKLSRLVLVKVFVNVLANLFKILGIESFSRI